MLDIYVEVSLPLNLILTGAVIYYYFGMLDSLNKCTSEKFDKEKKTLKVFYFALLVTFTFQSLFLTGMAFLPQTFLICQIFVRLLFNFCLQMTLQCFIIIPILLLHCSSFRKKSKDSEKESVRK